MHWRLNLWSKLLLLLCYWYCYYWLLLSLLLLLLLLLVLLLGPIIIIIIIIIISIIIIIIFLNTITTYHSKHYKMTSISISWSRAGYEIAAHRPEARGQDGITWDSSLDLLLTVSDISVYTQLFIPWWFLHTDSPWRVYIKGNANQLILLCWTWLLISRSFSHLASEEINTTIKKNDISSQVKLHVLFFLIS